MAKFKPFHEFQKPLIGFTPEVFLDYVVPERKRTFCKSARAIFSLPRDHFKI